MQQNQRSVLGKANFLQRGCVSPTFWLALASRNLMIINVLFRVKNQLRNEMIDRVLRRQGVLAKFRGRISRNLEQIFRGRPPARKLRWAK